MRAANVLIVEDDKSVAVFMKNMLQVKGFSITIAETGREAKSLFASCVPDVVLLDLGLPDMDGLEVLQYIRETAESNVPVIIVSARMEESEKVQALDLGADDYITKPCKTEELAARVRSALRRASVVGDARHYQAGELSVDLGKRTVMLAGKYIDLTPTEKKILICLIEQAGRVVPYKEITKKVWGPNVLDTATLRVNVVNIRRKLEKTPTKPEYIITEPSVGYMIVDNEYKKTSV